MTSKDEEMRIAVMGATGSGKSTFINTASGSNLQVSGSLESCTVDVETATFILDGRTVTLIDTPGFDDTTRSDTDVLKSITDYLANSYSEGVKLAGVIYMHRISDNKMGGPSRRNFHILRNIIGDAGLENVLLVTNMWSKVDPEDGEARERELASKEKFFKPALEKGSRMLRHDGSLGSAHVIIRQLFGRVPSTLLVQDEMVNQAKGLAETTVGMDIMDALKKQAERHEQALDDLCLGIEAAGQEDDSETKELLQEEARKARDKIERIRGDLERMIVNFAAQNTRLEDENRCYKKDLRKQKVDAQHSSRLLEQERKARVLADEGRKKAEAQLAAERELWEREKRWQARQAPERQERNHENRDHEEKEKERLEKERKEKEEEERGQQGRERNEYKKKEREFHQAKERAKEAERTRHERERQAKQENSGYSCCVQ